jgi:hypothetical protein
MKKKYNNQKEEGEKEVGLVLPFCTGRHMFGVYLIIRKRKPHNSLIKLESSRVEARRKSRQR